MKIFLLVANGHSGVTGQLRNVTSSIAFRTEKKALAYKKEFIKKLITPTDDHDLGYLDERNLKVHAKQITLAD